MLYNPPLLERGRSDIRPKEKIDDVLKGVEYNWYYTGKKVGTGNQIELHVTSIIRDWNENEFIRKSWYSGNREEWKKCLENHLRTHLSDLCSGRSFINRLMMDFEVRKANFRSWEKYNPVYYNL